ncbi:MAG: c-type cytochrome [Bacteroidia bacterium]|nr:c-type cytochrome [Bacteroidia bacterium]
MNKFLSIFLISLFFLAACGGNTGQQSAEPETKPEVAEETPTVSATQLAAGETVFKTYCMACHMADGMGVPGMNPPLSKTEYVNGDKDRLIGIVLNGLTEPLTINGETYSGIMAPHSFLSDDDIANVLTFVRSNFGNSSGPVTAAEVAARRAKQ